MATAAIKPSAEAACRLRRGGAVKTEGQWSMANGKKIWATRASIPFRLCGAGVCG